MNILINRCYLPIIRKKKNYKISLGNLFLDNFVLEKHYLFSQNKKILQSHLVGSLGDLVLIHDRKVVIEGYFKTYNSMSEMKFYNLDDQDKLKGIFPEIKENSMVFTYKKINLFFH